MCCSKETCKKNYFMSSTQYRSVRTISTSFVFSFAFSFASNREIDHPVGKKMFSCRYEEFAVKPRTLIREVYYPTSPWIDQQICLICVSPERTKNILFPAVTGS